MMLNLFSVDRSLKLPEVLAKTQQKVSKLWGVEIKSFKRFQKNLSDPDKKSSELTAKSEVNRSSLLSTDPKETAFVKFRPADRPLESQPSKTFSAQIHESGKTSIT